MTDIAKIAAGLSEAQQDMARGEYDPETASITDAAALIARGLWEIDWDAQDLDSEFYQFDVTPLGQQVRDYLKENNHVE